MLLLLLVVVGVSGWEVGHSVSRRPAGHSEESNYSLMDPTATAPARGATNVCLFSPPLKPDPLRVAPQVQSFTAKEQKP